MKPTQGNIITVSAPAKINLYFKVTGRRADGYHLIDSLIAFTALGDVLTIRADAPLDIVNDGPFAGKLPEPQQNLVYRAAEALANAAGIVPHGHITITKNLPIASGIGGGSSDAAAALNVLAKLWDIPDGAASLPEIGLSLGADLPVCLRSRTTYAGGIGEALDAAPPLPPVGILLVNPGVAVATASVFQAREGGFATPDRLEHRPSNAAELAAMLGRRGNDLTEAAIRLCPEIRAVLTALQTAPGCHLAQMSGSGATCFGLFDSVAAAQAAANHVSRDGWWVEPTELITKT